MGKEYNWSTFPTKQNLGAGTICILLVQIMDKFNAHFIKEICAGTVPSLFRTYLVINFSAKISSYSLPSL